jgi:hypothetical protein
VIIPTLEQTKTMQWADRGWYLVTEFEKTPSINFQRAIELAKTHPGFVQLMDERNVLIYRNIYREQELVQFQALYKFIRNWKGTKLYLKGDEVDYDLIESGVTCYIRTKLTETDLACETFNETTLDPSTPLGYIGCWRSYVTIEWHNDQPDNAPPCWFGFGRLDRHKVYTLNNEELEQFALGHLIEYYACPLLDLDHIRAFIRQLPDRIDPRKDKEWTYRAKPKTDRYVGHYTEPAILPISAEAYRVYLKRKLQHEY